jgi:hypothetical protein
VFCAEWIEPRYFSACAGRVFPHEHRVLARNERCFAVPAYGPLVRRYALVIPARHSTGMLTSLGQHERICVFEMLDLLLVSGLFPSKRLSVFEHGGACGVAGACIDHAHFHVVDSSIGVHEWFILDRPTAVPLLLGRSGSGELAGNYLFAGQYDHSGLLEGAVADDDETESQYFRRLIARHLDLQQWDWRAGMNLDWMSLFATDYWTRMGRPDSSSEAAIDDNAP